MDIPFAARLKWLRKHHKLTQAALARKIGKKRGRISALENGRRPPNASELNAFEQLFRVDRAGLGTLARKVPRVRKTRRKAVYRDFNATLPEPQRPPGPRTWVRLRATLRAYGQQGKALLAPIRKRRDRPAVNQFLHAADTGSRDELMLLLHLLGDGARFEELAIQRLGYRELAILDHTRRIVGDRPFPALVLPDVILFPQVTVRLRERPPNYPHDHATLDLLALVKVLDRTQWVNVDVNGGGHDGREDEIRADLIGLPRLVVTPVELARPDCARWFEKALEQLVREHLMLS